MTSFNLKINLLQLLLQIFGNCMQIEDPEELTVLNRLPILELHNTGFNLSMLRGFNSMENTTPLFIHGKKRTGSSPERFENIYPANGSVINEVSAASEKDVNDAVESARHAFETWSAMKGVERGRILRKAAAILRERNDELAEIEVEDTGKPVSEAGTVDILSGADALEFFGGIAASLEGSHIQLGKSYAYVKREPLGVCGGIGAWNYPIQIACWKAAPALACGNTMVFKPAELTPRNAVNLAEIFMEAGLPEGVFNVVQGGPEIGKKLVEHPGISKISLTGEVGTGQKVMEGASKTLKKLSLELGGKNPMIIFEDADIRDAVQGAMMGNFYTQGEICSNGTRVYVHKSVLDDFLDKLKEETAKLKIGDPKDKSTRIGALISSEHKEKVLNYIEIGKSQGGDLIIGGDEPDFQDGSPLNNGYFVNPAVFYTGSDDDRIVKEEIFGPVMTVLPFEEEQDVIRRANNTPYGLAAGVFTNDLKRAHRVIDRLQAGVCWINNYNITPVEVPFGGYKMSGIGRENGRAAVEEYTQLKTVYVEMEGVGRPFE
jgi:betaine-aldehyde dehydrogenase